MTVEEQRLADWLHAGTPQPPRDLRVEDILLRRPPSRRAWAPLLAAAVILLVAAVALALTSSGSRRHPDRVGTGHPTPASSATTRPATPPPPTARALPVDAWHLAPFGVPRDAVALAGDSRNLYAVTLGHLLLRLDPATGAVLARRSGVSTFGTSAPVLAGGLVWVVSGPTPRLDAFRADTLRDVYSVPLEGADATEPVTDGHDVVVGSGRSVIAVDATTGKVAFATTLPGADVRSVGLGYGGSVPERTLYAGTDGAIYTIRETTGDHTREAYPDTVIGLEPTSGGRWLLTASGMGQHVRFETRAGATREIASGGGGFPASMTRTGAVMWLGGDSRLVCADAATGQVRAQAVLSHGGRVVADVRSITASGGRTFAVLQAESGQQIVTLRPPDTCGG